MFFKNKMKKRKYIAKFKHIFYIIFALTTFSLFFNISSAHAQSPTVKPTVSESVNEKLNSQINQLKDKIASRVSELNLVEKKAFLGEVTESSTNKITLKDLKGNTKLVDVDEITKFSSGTSKTFGFSDLTKGTKITVLGLYNKQTKRLLARFISTSVNPIHITGGIAAIDTRNQTIDVISSDQKTTKVDIGTATKISSYGADGEPARLVFSRLVVGDRIAAIGYPDKTTPTLLVADRIAVLADAPKDPQINISQPTATPTTQPTLPAARRVSPTIRR
jgi:hypothetical protein